MELPRSFGPQGTKPTHDFLSLYTTTSTTSHSQDPLLSPGSGSFLKTQNFLQPLEQVEMPGVNDPAAISVNDKIQLPAASHLPPTSVEHILPGGIGTYTISHISCINQVSKPEVSLFTAAQANSNERNDDNSNSSSQTGSGFTLWEESAVNMGKTGKENVREGRSFVREPASKLGKWAAERPSQSSLNQRGSFAPASSSQVAAHKNRSLMNLIVSTTNTREDENREMDFVIKKEGSPSEREESKMRAEGKNDERKANTPRSKHSATEQRRRSKINDRFQMLREIIPHSDQKRDKASFLLEAIEYIQFLQEKVYRYEGSFPGWNHESTKRIPLRNNHKPAKGFVDHGGPGTTSPFSTKFSDKNIGAPSIVPRVVQKQVESDNNPIAFQMNDQHLVRADMIVASPIPLQPKVFVENGGTTTIFPPKLVSDTETATSQHTQREDVRRCEIECATPSNDQELAIEGGTINISSTYSQGFLSTLTQALQSLGVDLSQSRISVQIDLGKQNNIKLGSATKMTKVDELNSTSHVKANSTSPHISEYSGQAVKRLKTGN
uniref:BHLH domain-containing protein n=1 Tax=Kalanchoe fedtschenkoi TaxID=63787 RepID=A0A7N0UEN2_KALFE